jgi:hypothetical protein
VIMPGSTEVLDRATGELVPCTPELCPHAIDGVNHAPFAAFGGWSGGINAAADPAVKDAAYAFLSYVNQPAQSNTDVTIGATGFNPYRISQLTDFSLWEEAGMSQETAEVYLGAPRWRSSWPTRSTATPPCSRSTTAGRRLPRSLAATCNAKPTSQRLACSAKLQPSLPQRLRRGSALSQPFCGSFS